MALFLSGGKEERGKQMWAQRPAPSPALAPSQTLNAALAGAELGTSAVCWGGDSGLQEWDLHLTPRSSASSWLPRQRLGWGTAPKVEWVKRHLLNMQFKLSQSLSYKLGQQQVCTSWGGKTDTPDILQHTNTIGKGSMSWWGDWLHPGQSLEEGIISSYYILINLVQGGSSKREPEQQNGTFWPLSRRWQ